MPGSSKRSPQREILDFLNEAPHEPFTANKIASETGLSLETVQNELNGLGDQGLLQEKEINGTDQLWWRPSREREDDEQSDSVPLLTDAPDGQDTRGTRQRLLEQHR